MSKDLRSLLVLFALLAPATSAFAIGAVWPLSDTPRFWILGEGLGHLAFDGSYFQSTQNFDANGNAYVPANETSTRFMDFRVHGGFGFTPRLSVFAQTEYRGISAPPVTAPNVTGATSSGTSFGDTFVGFRWLVYRSSPTDRVYPTEWAPRTFVGIVEGTWAFPLYGHAPVGSPPVGDQSDDFSGIARIAWYTNEWFALSAGSGYIYRTAGYAPVIPWTLRADVSAQELHKVRFWADAQGLYAFNKTNTVLNPQQPDPFPNGSYLYKSYAPNTTTGELGVGYLISQDWELVAAGSMTLQGVNAAKGVGFGLGLTWRPYQTAEVKYDAYRKRQVDRAQTERKVYQRRDVVKYGFRATIIKVSKQGNYVKIAYGEKDRVHEGDTFYLFTPSASLKQANPKPVAFATAVKVLPDSAFLQVAERYVPKAEIKEGYEARRVYFESEDE